MQLTSLSRVALFAGLVSLIARIVSAQVAAPPAESEPVARVGGHAITLADVERRWAVDDPGGYQRAQADLYANRRRALEALLTDLLLGAEAARTGRSTADLIGREAAARARAITDADVQAFLDANPLPAGVPSDEGRGMVRALLRQRAEAEAREGFVRQLLADPTADVRLAPPRSHPGRAAHSPSRGPADAPVELVVFSDFDCPFCRRADPVLGQLMTRFAGKMRLVWRHYPLSIHPGAQPAAVAAQCAHAQDRFWPFHDGLLARGGEPDAGGDRDAGGERDAIRSVARAVGLDLGLFDRCLASDAPAREVTDDLRAGDAAGVAGTPTVFINGIAVVGAQPIEVYERIVRDELRARGVVDDTETIRR